MLLELKAVDAGYNKKQVLHGVSLTVEIVALVGHNGAGKSTTLRTITGLLHPTAGRIFYLRQEITRQAPAENVKAGMSLVPQGGRVFAQLSVRENLELGGFLIRDHAALRQRIAEVLAIFPALEGRQTQRAGSLSGGERQMLAIGRALMLTPKLLMLDEPSIGLAPMLVKDVMRTVKEINARFGTGILIVEQNVREAFGIARRAYVMRLGRVVLAEEQPAALLGDEKLRRAYIA